MLQINHFSKIILLFASITIFMSFSTTYPSNLSKEKEKLCTEYATKNGSKWFKITNNKTRWRNCIKKSTLLGKHDFIKNDNFKVKKFNTTDLTVRINNNSWFKKEYFTVKLTQSADGDKLGFTEAELDKAIHYKKD